MMGLVCGAGTSRAAIPPVVFDLRVANTGAKEALVSSPGDTVLMDLFVTVIGSDADPTNDGFQSAIGSFKSSFGGMRGDLFGLPPSSPFNGPASSRGLAQDLDGDGDLDVGGIDDQNAEDYYAVRSSSMQTEQPAGGFWLGRVRFTARTLNDQPTSVNFFARNAYFFVALADGAILGNVGSTKIGAPVVIRQSQVVGNGTTTFLSGMINTHLVVSGTVRPTAGQALTLAAGATVQPAGDLLCTRLDANDSLSKNNGGTLNTEALNVGFQPGADGTFNQIAGLTRVGIVGLGGSTPTGNATLRIAGGTLEAGALVQSRFANSTSLLQTGGVANVDQLIVDGGATQPALAQLDGGEFMVNGSALVAGNNRAAIHVNGGSARFDDLTLGHFTGSVGTLHVSAGACNVNILNVGNGEGTGRFVQEGGLTVAQTVSFDGPNVAAAGAGTGELTGGELRTYQLFVASMFGSGNAKFTQTGGTLTVGLQDGSGRGGVHAFRSAALQPIQSVEFLGGVAKMASMTVGQSPTETGRALISGGDVTVDYAYIGDAAPEPSNTVRSGTLSFSSGSFTIARQLSSDGALDFTNAAVTLRTGDRSFINFATTNAGTIVNSSNTTLVGGTDSLLNFPAGFDPFSGFASIQTQGLIHVNGQPLTIPQGRTFAGSGSIDGDVTNHGTVSPGHSAGQIVMLDDYAQDPSALLAIEIGGRTSDLFDVLSISGAASLDGTLSVNLIDDFVPLTSDSFTFLTADGGILGRFANTLGDKIYFDGGRFDVTYSSNSVMLSNFAAVPEPAGVVVGLLSYVGLLARRRRF